MVLVGLGGFAGGVLFGVLYVLFFLKGGSLKLPIIGMAACIVVVAVSAVMLNLIMKEPADPSDPDSTGEPAETEQGGEEGSAAPDEDGEAISEQVLLDKRGIVITAMGLDTDGSFGPELKLLIENNSETDVNIQARNVSVNGYMVEAVFSTEAAAGKKVNDAVTILESSLQKCGIETIADIELSFSLLDTHMVSFLESDPAKISTSEADSYQYSYDDAGDEVCNEKGVRIVSRGISNSESLFGSGLIVFIENTTGQTITVQSRDVSVNGKMVDAIFSQDVAAGKHCVTAVTVMDSSLEKNGISEIEDMELYFHVFAGDGRETILDTSPITASKE
ncbi:MAG: hypothetical protein K2K53_04190 [Oscillospiraceae bacterium]|nr:hypothetical protein [Oscillospiraceae bacterium]